MQMDKVNCIFQIAKRSFLPPAKMIKMLYII